MIKIIVAMDKNGLIGSNNNLPWKLTNDLSYFRKKTWGQNIVMGRKTFESVGVLPNRNSIVLTRNPDSVKRQSNVSTIQSPEAILDWTGDFFIIGGAEVYERYLPYADVMYITKIDEVFEGDTHFPNWNRNEWTLASEDSHSKNDGHDYDHTFLKYVRKQQ